MRLAVKVAYDGSFFHGSQRQGDEDPGSVEGAIASALRKVSPSTKWDTWPMRFSSRTDSGVSALGNVFTVDSDMDPDELLRALNANIDNIWCWGWGKPRQEQNIRWANNRWYRYHLPPGTMKPEDLPRFNNALSLFVGEHDFRNFCRLEDEKNPVTVIERAEGVDLSGSGDLIVVDIVGSRFLWQQVRRTIGAALDVVNGTLEEPDIKARLDDPKMEEGSNKGNITTMPPTGLVLMDVRFKDIDFIVSEQALGLGLKRSSEEAWKASIKVIMNTALRSLKPV
jgi:tRNA pseudouridine38-40 synthase